MGEFIVCFLFALVFYFLSCLMYKFITAKTKETHNKNDFAIVEYANGEEVKLVKNMETDVYEEIEHIEHESL